MFLCVGFVGKQVGSLAEGFQQHFFSVKKESIQEFPAAPFKEGLGGHVFLTIFYKCPFCRISKRIEFLHKF